DDEAAADLVLLYWEVGGDGWLDIGLVVPLVADDADYRAPWAVGALAEALADRAIRPETRGECLVDDYDWWTLLVVVRVEGAALDERHTHRVEIVWAHVAAARDHDIAACCFRDVAFDSDVFPGERY